MIRTYYNNNKIIQNIFYLEPNYKENVFKRTKSIRKFLGKIRKTRYWWENFVSGKVFEEEWREIFRMCREMFEILCAELYPYRFKDDTGFRNTVPVDKQVAVTF